MSKRGENIYKRKDGRWEGRYIKDRKENGMIQYGYVYAKTYKETKEKLTILKAKFQFYQQRTITYYDTVPNYMKFWLNTSGKLYLKETTYSKYSRIIRNHIEPFFYTFPLYKLSERHCTDFLHLLLKKGMSPGSIRNIFNLLRKALNVAVREGYIEKNPCKEIVLPKMLKKEVRALSLKEHLAIEAIVVSEKECSPILVALYTGMRIGELSGLRWTDVDFEENTIYVRQTVTRISVNDLEKKTKILITKPKTATSYRKIPLAENLKNYLLEKKNNSTNSFVFSYKGQMMEPRLINYRFKAVLKKACLENIHFHMLRHSFATRGIETGIDIVTLSKILGHSSTKMTLDTYAYSIYDNRVAAMEKIDQLMVSPN